MFLRLDSVNGQVAAFESANGDVWNKVGNTIAVPAFNSAMSGGMELWSASTTHSVSSVDLQNFAVTNISAIPTPPPTSVSVQNPSGSGQKQNPVTVDWKKLEIRMGLIIFLVLFLILVTQIISSYNQLVLFRNKTENAWAHIDVQLKLRHDLVYNLVEIVKGYATHESATFERVTLAHAAAINARTVVQQVKAENVLSATLNSLLGVVEAYPNLKANTSFLALHQNLASIENVLASIRQEYNNTVLYYNTRIQSFPTNLLAWMFRFTKREFFGVTEEEERNAPKASFDAK